MGRRWDILAGRYDVRNAGFRHVMRERIVRRRDDGTLPARWVNPIHEQLRPAEGAIRAHSNNLVWIHQPEKKCKLSADRNFRILRHHLNAAGLYYLQQEYFHKRDIENFKKYALSAYHLPETGPIEKYEIMCNLALLSEGEERYTWVGKAVSHTPWRREAYALWAQILISDGCHQQALWILKHMHNIPCPNPAPWTHQARWYQDAGIRLLAQTQRMCGEFDNANKNENDMFEQHGRKISLLHATRGRPEAAVRAMGQWLSKAHIGARIEHIFAIDSDDKLSRDALMPFRSVICTVPEGGKGSCVAAWNAAAQLAQGEVLVQLSDDWLPPFGWDEMILNAIGDTLGAKVLAIGDGHRDDMLLCMAICTRKRWEDQGCHLFSPEYESVYSDNEFSFRAWRDGVVIDKRKEIIFEHDHPIFKGKQWAEMDQTYQDQNSRERYERGLETFKRRNPDAP